MSNLVWKMQHYDLVREFHSKPVLVPPFILFANIFLFVRHVAKSNHDRRKTQQRDYLLCHRCQYRHCRKFEFREYIVAMTFSLFVERIDKNWAIDHCELKQLAIIRVCDSVKCWSLFKLVPL